MPQPWYYAYLSEKLTVVRQKNGMNEILIRPEISADHGAVRDLIVTVFTETYGSGEVEAALVEQLRQRSEQGVNISLVAELDEVVVGHIYFSPVQIKDHPDIPVCVLAPLGVTRQYQKQGIGSQLAREGLKACADQGYKVVVVQGSLEYYPRFGFIPIDGTGLTTIFKSEHDMVLELEDGILENLSGLVDYPELWHALI